MNEPRQLANLINGKWVDSSSDERIDVVNPANGEKIATMPSGSTNDVDRAVEAARSNFEQGTWRRAGHRERARVLRRVGELMMQRREVIAASETLDQGRPIRQSMGMMVPLAAAAWDFFASALMTHAGSAARPEPWATALSFKQPVGVVGCITPGNVPLVLGSEKLAPALAVGNSVILKPPPQCPISSTLLTECIVEAGVPDGVISLVHGDGAVVGSAMASHPGIDMIAFTGSTAVGKEIMKLASVNVKKLLLELGGKAPQVVFADADIGAAVEGAMWGAYLNGGQICMATTRILVQEAAYDEFSEGFVRQTEKLRVGPGIDPTTDLGPMVSAAVRDRVESYIAQGRADGARVLSGGQPMRDGEFSDGYFVQPTVFADTSPGMSIVCDEIFGPVPTLQRFSTAEEAIRIANDTPYGLTGSVWTRDLETSLRMAEEVRVGYVWVNDHLVRAPNLPFGGWKESGFGREAAAQTLDEYSQTKSVFIDRSGVARKPRYDILYPG